MTNRNSGDFTKNPTFQVLFQHWLEDKSLRVRRSSLAIYHCHVYAHLIPLFGEYRTDAVTERDLNRICFTELPLRADEKGMLSPKSRIDLIRTLNNVLRFGFEQGYFAQRMQAEYPKMQKSKINVLRDTELARLEQALYDDFPKRDAFGIYLCLYTGIRVGELCGLKWEDFDLKNGLLYIRRTVQRVSFNDSGGQKTVVMIGPPKSFKSEREIPIPEHLLEYLKKWKKEQKDNYFLSDSPHCYEPRRMQRAYQFYLKKAEIEPLGFHSTRHTFATRWVEAGIDIKTLSEILGHTSIRITMDKYVHISEKTKRENINKIKPFYSCR